jgi:hypothetical protein
MFDVMMIDIYIYRLILLRIERSTVNLLINGNDFYSSTSLLYSHQKKFIITIRYAKLNGLTLFRSIAESLIYICQLYRVPKDLYQVARSQFSKLQTKLMRHPPIGKKSNKLFRLRLISELWRTLNSILDFPNQISVY